MADVVSFSTVLEALVDMDHPFPARYLRRFSDLDPADLAEFLKLWSQVDTARKHTLLEDLEELAESDTLTNFDELSFPLLKDPDPAVRALAIRLLWENEDPRLGSQLLQMVKDDGDDGVRASSANALGRFIFLGELEKIPAHLHHAIEDQLLEILDSTSSITVRRRALESLGYSGREEVSPLIEKGFHSKDVGWKASALYAMGRSCDDRWSKTILSQLRAEEEEIRIEAVHAAGELELRPAAPILLDMLADEEPGDLRHELIWALSRIGGEGVRARMEELIEMEEDDDELEFLEESFDTLSFTEDLGGFSLLDVDPDIEFLEDHGDEQD